MIDPKKETMIKFRQAGRHITGNPAVCTLHRWRLPPGVRGSVLETLLIGGIRWTSEEAIARFIAAQNPDQQPAPGLTKSQRRRQAETADRLLQESGV